MFRKNGFVWCGNTSQKINLLLLDCNFFNYFFPVHPQKTFRNSMNPAQALLIKQRWLKPRFPEFMALSFYFIYLFSFLQFFLILQTYAIRAVHSQSLRNTILHMYFQYICAGWNGFKVPFYITWRDFSANNSLITSWILEKMKSFREILLITILI